MPSPKKSAREAEASVWRGRKPNSHARKRVLEQTEICQPGQECIPDISGGLYPRIVTLSTWLRPCSSDIGGRILLGGGMCVYNRADVAETYLPKAADRKEPGLADAGLAGLALLFAVRVCHNKEA